MKVYVVFLNKEVLSVHKTMLTAMHWVETTALSDFRLKDYPKFMVTIKDYEVKE